MRYIRANGANDLSSTAPVIRFHGDRQRAKEKCRKVFALVMKRGC
jgi:hypothetical protein